MRYVCSLEGILYYVAFYCNLHQVTWVFHEESPLEIFRLFLLCSKILSATPIDVLFIFPYEWFGKHPPIQPSLVSTNKNNSHNPPVLHLWPLSCPNVPRCCHPFRSDVPAISRYLAPSRCTGLLHRNYQNLIGSDANHMYIYIYIAILLMEEILHYLGCKKTCK